MALLVLLLFRTFLPPKIIFAVKSECRFRQCGVLNFQFFQQLLGHLATALSRVSPDFLEVDVVCIVLCYTNRVSDVHDSMPPSARHVDGVSRLLNTLDDFVVALVFLDDLR